MRTKLINVCEEAITIIGEDLIDDNLPNRQKYSRLQSRMAKILNECKGSGKYSLKLKQAIDLLIEVSENWDEDKCEQYPVELESFDEVISALSDIRISF